MVKTTRRLFMINISRYLTDIDYDEELSAVNLKKILTYINYIYTGKKEHVFSKSREEAENTVYGLFIFSDNNEKLDSLYKTRKAALEQLNIYKKKQIDKISYKIKKMKLN